MKIYVASALYQLIKSEQISALLVEELSSCNISDLDICDLSMKQTTTILCKVDNVKIIRPDSLTKEERIQLGSELYCIDSKGWLANPHKAYHFIQIKKIKSVASNRWGSYIPDFDGVSRYNEEINTQ